MKPNRLIVILMLALCGMTAQAGEDVVVVIIKDFKFIPEQVTVKPGQTIRWENHEKRQYHSVWFEQLGEEEPADYLFPQDSYERRFDAAGNFPYRCGPHPEMLGSVVVAE
jgi:plastocyanin